MPIKPENKDRYPADWKQIRARILERAKHCCEGSPKHPDCRIPNRAHRVKSIERWTFNEDEAHAISDGTPGDVVQIVLTIGHLDHTPENCADDNLKAWCQRCHLVYDAEHHAQTARATRRAGRAAADLFPATQRTESQ